MRNTPKNPERYVQCAARDGRIKSAPLTRTTFGRRSALTRASISRKEKS
jgi:hypothetical protein